MVFLEFLINMFEETSSEVIGGVQKENLFKPDKLKLGDVVEQIKNLQDGEMLKISHAFMVVRLGGKNIAVDPAIEARSLNEKEANKYIPLSKGEASKSVKERGDVYTHTLIDASDESGDNPAETNTKKVGLALADHIDAVLISHLDADHYDFELIRSMMEKNQNLQVFGPLGWQNEIVERHSNEVLGDKPTLNYLPEKIYKRLKAFSAKPADPEKEKGWFYPGDNMDRLIMKSADGQEISIKAIDIPHMGGLPVEYVQGIILESQADRIMIIPDAALSPEVVEHINTNAVDQNGRSLTQIVVSTATLNPEAFYGILDEEQSNTLRDEIEEAVAHSAYLPLIAAAYTSGETEVNIAHSGFYHRSSSDEKHLRNRYPEYKQTDNPEPKEWLGRLRQKVDETLFEMESEIKTLGPLTVSVGRHGRAEISHLLRDFPIRRKFATTIINWIKTEGVPDSVLANIHIPKSNEIVKKV